MVRKVIVALLVVAIAPLIAPSRASAHHEAVFLPQKTVSFQCFTVTRLQPVSHFVFATNGVFVRLVKTEPVQEVQCVPAQVVQSVFVKRVVIIRQNGNGVFLHNGNGFGNGVFRHRGNGHFKKFQIKIIVVRHHVQFEKDDDDD